MNTPNLNKSLAVAKLQFPQILANRKVKIPTKSGREISFTYAELEEIIDNVTPVLSANGLSLSSQMRYLENGKFCLVTTLRHESGEYIESFFPLPESVGDAKDLGSQISYGRRYNALCLLEISVVEPSNQQQWQETKRKVASEIRQEVNGVAPPTKPQKENGGLLEATSGQTNIGKISKAQASRLWTIAKNELALSEGDVKSVFAEFNVESTTDISAADYDKVIERLKTFNTF